MEVADQYSAFTKTARMSDNDFSQIISESVPTCLHYNGANVPFINARAITTSGN